MEHEHQLEVVAEHHDLAGQKLEAFEKQQGIMRQIYEKGFSEYAESVDGLADAFDPEKHKPVDEMHNCVCCMDERTPFGKRAAGSGILLPESERQAFYDKVKPDSISSHTGCGAAAIYCKQNNIPAEQAESVAWQFAEDEAKKLGVPHIHLEVSKPFHGARVCYYNGVENFSPAGVKGLPEGFVVNRHDMDKKACLAEAEVAGNIAFGHHGLEELNSEENPFLYVVVADTEAKMGKLKKELEGKLGKFGKKIKIDGFVSPK